MEEQSLDPLFALQEAISAHESLRAEMAAAPDRLKPTFELALHSSRQAMEAHAQSEPVRELARRQQEQLDADVRIVQSLVDRGHLSIEQAEQQFEGLFRHEDYRVLRLVRRLGASATTPAETLTAASVAPESLSPATPGEVSPLRPLTEKTAQIIFSGPGDAEAVPVQTAAAVPVAKPISTPAQPRAAAQNPEATNQGWQPIRRSDLKIHSLEADPLSDKQIRITLDTDTIVVNGREFTNDYFRNGISRHIDFVRAIAKLTPGQRLTPHDLWDMVYPGEPFDKRTLTTARTWIQREVVTPTSKTELLVHNGKRGNASAYVRNPKIELQFKDLQATDTPVEQLPELSAESLAAFPTVSERKLMCLIVDEITHEFGDKFSFATAAKEENVDFSRLSEEESGDLIALSLHKLKSYALSEPAREDLVAMALEKGDDHILHFLATIQPRLQRYMANFPDDQKLLAMAHRVMARVRVPRPQR